MKTMKQLLHQMRSMRIGLLKIDEEDTRLCIPVEAIGGNEECYEWSLIEELGEPLITKQVNLVQKQGDDYIYITAIVSAQRTKIRTIITLQIQKACWMIRKIKGSVSWLEEHFIYERMQTSLKAAS